MGAVVWRENDLAGSARVGSGRRGDFELCWYYLDGLRKGAEGVNKGWDSDSSSSMMFSRRVIRGTNKEQRRSMTLRCRMGKVEQCLLGQDVWKSAWDVWNTTYIGRCDARGKDSTCGAASVPAPNIWRQWTVPCRTHVEDLEVQPPVEGVVHPRQDAADDEHDDADLRVSASVLHVQTSSRGLATINPAQTRPQPRIGDNS